MPSGGRLGRGTWVGVDGLSSVLITTGGVTKVGGIGVGGLEQSVGLPALGVVAAAFSKRRMNLGAACCRPVLGISVKYDLARVKAI